MNIFVVPFFPQEKITNKKNLYFFPSFATTRQEKKEKKALSDFIH